MLPFITFEDIEGSGKTPQIQQFAVQLRQRVYQVLQTREPGDCVTTDQIRGILPHSDNCAIVSRAERLLYAAARARHIEEVVQPALATGEIVPCERLTDATLAYLGYGRGLNRQLIGQQIPDSIETFLQLNTGAA